MIIVKQWGIQRSGTNAIRGLLERNFSNVTVFSSLLGWKHGCPGDPEAWIKEHAQPDDSVRFQGLHMLFTATELRHMLKTCKMCHLVSVKEPEAFIVSHAAYRGQPLTDHEWVGRQIARYNNVYRSWWRLRSDNRPWACVMHSDLIGSPEDTLLRLQRQFGLTRSQSQWSLIHNRMNRCTDCAKASAGDTPFNADWYRHRKYLDKLPVDTLRLIQEQTDQALLADYRRFGRKRDPHHVPVLGL